MKFNASLDINVVGHEANDELAVLLDLEAPASPLDARRPPGSMQVVLDRSGSMSGPPLEGAKRALIALVQRLEPTDNFGIVTFDDESQIVVPAGPITDKQDAVNRIQSIRPGGMTDLSAGYLRGIRELRRAAEVGGTVLVISDGHVNGGLRDPAQFAELAGRAGDRGVVTSTVGYGRGYDETLLAAIATAGSGNHVFADDPDAAGAAIAQEVDGLLAKVVQAVTLTVTFEPTVEMLRFYNDLPAQQIGDGKVMIELGDLYGHEARKLLMKFRIPAMAALGLAQVAALELQYVELPGLVEHTVTLPISVNVVPGDEATRRVPDPTVRSEALFQEAQESKKRASEAFERGDLDTGKQLLDETRAALEQAEGIAPPNVVRSIVAEKEHVEQMGLQSDTLGAPYMSKMTRASFHRQNRKRGRRDDFS